MSTTKDLCDLDYKEIVIYNYRCDYQLEISIRYQSIISQCYADTDNDILK